MVQLSFQVNYLVPGKRPTILGIPGIVYCIFIHCYDFQGYLWKDKSEDGVRKILEDNIIPLDRLLVETDSPFMYPNTRASKLPQHVKDALTEK